MKAKKYAFAKKIKQTMRISFILFFSGGFNAFFLEMRVKCVKQFNKGITSSMADIENSQINCETKIK